MMEISSLMERFIKYAVFNDDGDLTGIYEDAPDEAKKAFDKFNEIQRKAREGGLKI